MLLNKTSVSWYFGYFEIERVCRRGIEDLRVRLVDLAIDPELSRRGILGTRAGSS
jgi:hypothetical protein